MTRRTSIRSRYTKRRSQRSQRRLGVERLEERALMTAVAPPSGLVSWWTADNTAADLKGLNNATLVSGATYAAGKVGQAFSLDGVNDRVQMADSESLKLTNSLTIEGWIKADSIPAQQGEILFRGDDRGGLDPYSLSLQSNGSLRFEIVSGPDAMNLWSPITVGEWFHVTASLDDATGAMKLYMNGELAAQTVTAVRPFGDLDPASNPGIGIGNHGGYPNTPHNFPFDGLIDELSVYNRALTAGEIQDIYNAGSDGKIKSPNYVVGDSLSVVEGQTGSTTAATFTLTRVGNLSEQVIVNWTTADGTATAGSDYAAAAGQVVFQNGESAKTVEVLVNGDGAVESAETFSLALSTPTPGWGVGGGLATIMDDDIGVSMEDTSVIEGDIGLTSLGAFVQQSANGGLTRSAGMAWGPDGNLYVGSLNTDEILRFDGTSGAFLSVFVSTGSGGLDGPAVQGLHFRPDGKLYVLSRENAQVLRYDAATGAFVDVFIPSGSGGLAIPKGMTVGPDGNWYISSDTNEVLRYSGATGAFLGVFVSAGSGGLTKPRGLVFGPDGILYVASSNSSAVLRYDGATGAFLGTHVPPNSGGLAQPGELLFDGDSLYVSSQGSSQVLRFDAATGTFLNAVVTTGTSDVDRPIGLLLDPDNNLLVGTFGDILRYGPASTAVFTVRLSQPSTNSVTVEYATDSGTAAAGSDFTSVTGTVSFAPGQTARTVHVPILDDALSESPETFVLNLYAATGASITDGQGVAVIQDDETIYQLTVTDVSVTEGDQTPHYRGPFASGNVGEFQQVSFYDGKAYVGSNSNRIRRYDFTTGELIDTLVSSGRINGVRDILFREGLMYVGSEYTDEVLRFDAATGAFDRAFVTAGSGGLGGTHGMTFGPDANSDGVPELYVTGRDSHNVVRYDGATGLPLGTYVTTGSGGLSWPEGLAFDPSGSTLYVSSPGSNQILKYNAQTGAYLGVAASTGLQGPLDVEFGPDGLMYVASAGNDRIMRFNTNGNYVDDYVPAGAGGMDYPYRVHFGPDGDLYVTAQPATQILRFGSDSEAIFSVLLSQPRNEAVTVQYATANGTAVAGADYTATSGIVTFAPGQTTRTVLVPILDDTTAESPETFTLSLFNPDKAIIADGQGTATISDNDATKFFVVNDGSPDRTYEYGESGASLDNFSLNSGNSAPRGAAATAAGDTIWVADKNRKVYVYDSSGAPQGSWSAGTLSTRAQVEGVATNGIDVWIVDNYANRVYRYSNAAGRLSGSQNAASSFALNSGNKNPKGIVTDGTHLWVVNDASTDKVFKYTVGGSYVGSWTIGSANKYPTGLTIDPSNGSQDIWIVDNGTDRVYQYSNARGKTSGSLAPAASFALAAGNTNPQGIADPPAPSSESVTVPVAAGRDASSVHPMALALLGSSMSARLPVPEASIPAHRTVDEVFAALGSEHRHFQNAASRAFTVSDSARRSPHRDIALLHDELEATIGSLADGKRCVAQLSPSAG